MQSSEGQAAENKNEESDSNARQKQCWGGNKHLKESKEFNERSRKAKHESAKQSKETRSKGKATRNLLF